MATAMWKAELLNSLRKQVKCCQVMDVSPPNSLPSGEYVLLGKRSRALDFRFDGAKRISENLMSEERELTTVSGKGPASTNSMVSQLSPEPRLKKRRVEAADSTMERRFEGLERRMEAMEADNVDLRRDTLYLRDRLKRVEAQLEQVERRMKLYMSSGINLIAVACSLMEYAVDLISFEQRNIIATQVLRLIPSIDVQPDSVKKINVEFRSFWGGAGYIEDVRFNRFVKDRRKKPEEISKAAEAVRKVALDVGVLEEELDVVMLWYILDYRISKNLQVHVFGLFKDPAYEQVKPEEKKKGSNGRRHPKTIEELVNRFQKNMQKPEYAGFTGNDLIVKEQMLKDVLDHLEDLPDEFKAHEIVFKALAEHARKELVTLQSQQSGRRYVQHGDEHSAP